MLIKKANDIALKKLVWENPIFIVEKFWLETEKKDENYYEILFFLYTIYCFNKNVYFF